MVEVLHKAQKRGQRRSHHSRSSVRLPCDVAVRTGTGDKCPNRSVLEAPRSSATNTLELTLVDPACIDLGRGSVEQRCGSRDSGFVPEIPLWCAATRENQAHQCHNQGT